MRKLVGRQTEVRRINVMNVIVSKRPVWPSARTINYWLSSVLVMFVDWPKVVFEYSLGDSVADLVAILDGVPPVQASPNTRVA